MARCEQCGQKLARSAYSCPNCGAPRTVMGRQPKKQWAARFSDWRARVNTPVYQSFDPDAEAHRRENVKRGKVYCLIEVVVLFIAPLVLFLLASLLRRCTAP